jgi:hypothetical protein
MSFYLIVFQGGSAVGSAALGLTAEHAGLSPALLISAAGLALGPLAGLRYRFQSIPPAQLLPAADWPAPGLVGAGEEHLRQHDRVTARDQQRYDAIRSMTDPAHPVTVTHWLTPPPAR